MLAGGPDGLWRRLSDEVHRCWLARRLRPGCRLVLKTDLFEEAAGEGLIPLLRLRADRVVGIDIAGSVVRAARNRYPGFAFHSGDVRNLAWHDRTFDAVVSTSTLDHMETAEEIQQGLQELARVLRPGGQLLITLDNPVHPLVKLRTLLPRGWICPFHLGPTLAPEPFRDALAEAGFDVLEMTALLHCPRVLVKPLLALLEGWTGQALQRGILAAFLSFERLAALDSRYYTGHFIAAWAVRG